MIWGERLGRGPGGAAALGRCCAIADALDCSADGGGVFSVPDGANARGVREVGCLPGAGPGFAAADPGRDLDGIKDGLADGELDGVILVHADPVRDLPDGPGWAKALNNARTVVAISSFDDASTKAADVVFPAEAYAEKEGTVTHPDGRLQRLRPAVPRPGQVRPVWQVLAELAAGARRRDRDRLRPRGARGDRLRGPLLRRPHAGGDRRHGHPLAGTPQAAAGGLGGWPADSRAGRCEADGERWPRLAQSPRPPGAARGLRLGTYRDLWADEVTERNVGAAVPRRPSSGSSWRPSDAERLGLDGRRRGRRAVERAPASAPGSRCASGCGPGRRS